jgi:hypothetical protein
MYSHEDKFVWSWTHLKIYGNIMVIIIFIIIICYFITYAINQPLQGQLQKQLSVGTTNTAYVGALICL